jgi:hypothetical protein
MVMRCSTASGIAFSPAYGSKKTTHTLENGVTPIEMKKNNPPIPNIAHLFCGGKRLIKGPFNAAGLEV